MKTCCFTIFLTLFFLNARSQDLACSDLHEGSFTLDGKEFGIITIERTANSQTETCDLLNFKATYDIVWTGECEYELRNKKVLKGESKYGNEATDAIKATVIKISGNSILLRLTSNFADFETECEITKTK